MLLQELSPNKKVIWAKKVCEYYKQKKSSIGGIYSVTSSSTGGKQPKNMLKW